VVPKLLRQRLRLKAGSRIRIWEEDGRLLLEPVPEETLLVQDGGLLLCGGHLDGGSLTIEALRDERIDALVNDAIR
jgi:bifunctional DNA-binding transcriptional regulator/antitoxin component of YhaV-PrlF toxin-antitoxin module